MTQNSSAFTVTNIDLAQGIVGFRAASPDQATTPRQQIVVDNRHGVNGDEMSVRAAPDGYMLPANSLAIGQFIFPE